MGIQVVIDDPAELEKIRTRESDITKERIQRILNTGANVILTTKGIDDMSLKYFVEAGAIACRRVPKEDLRCAASGKSCLQRYSQLPNADMLCVMVVNGAVWGMVCWSVPVLRSEPPSGASQVV